MAYEKGDLKFGVTMDSRTDDYDTSECLYLPHSCSDWVIGNLEQAEMLYQELGDLINKIKQK